MCACLTCGVSGWTNRETGEIEPAGFRGPKPLKCLKASMPSHPMCQLSVRSFNCLMNEGLTNKEEILSLINSGKFPYTRNCGRKTLIEIANWCGSKRKPKTLIKKYLGAYEVRHAEYAAVNEVHIHAEYAAVNEVHMNYARN